MTSADLAAAPAPPVRRAGVGQGSTIVVAAFLPIMAIVSLAPAIPSLFAHFATVPNVSTLVPLMVTAPGLFIALTSPGAGWLADRYGRRPILLFATLAYGVLGLAPFVLHGINAIFVSRLFLGICEAAILTATNALIGDYFAPAQRRTWLTIQGVVGPIFGTVVILSCGAITERYWNGAFLVYAVAFPIFLAMLVFIYEPLRSTAKASTPRAAATPFPWRAVAAFSVTTLFASIMYYVGIVQMGLAFAAVGVKSSTQVGLLISIASVGVPIGALVFGALSLRLSRAMLCAIFFSLLGVGMIGMGMSHDVRLTTGLAIVQQMGAGMTVPALLFWATGVLDVRHRGRGMGCWNSAFFLGQFVSPVFVGLARGATGGILGAFVVMGAVALGGALVATGIGARRASTG